MPETFLKKKKSNLDHFNQAGTMIKLLEVIQSLLNKCRPVTTDRSSLQVLGFGDDTVWVTLLKPGHNLWVQKMDAIQLVPKSYPTGERTNPER